MLCRCLPLFVTVPAIALFLAGPASAQDEPAPPSATVENQAAAAEQTPESAASDVDKTLGDLPPMSPGQADLDKAIELKLVASDLRQLGTVIDLLDEAIDKGLDEGEEKFAKSVLVASLFQRATALSAAVFKAPPANARPDIRMLQIRQFALTDLRRVTELDDTLAEAHLLIGRIHSTPPLRDPNAARRALSKAVDADNLDADKRAQAYALRGATQRNVKKRLADFSQAVEFAPERIEYRLIRAREHQRMKEYDAALADVDGVLEKEPDNASAHEMKALVLLAQDKPAEAIESFDRATEIAPQSVAPYQYRGEAYSRLGDTKEAINQLDQAIQIDPSNIGSRLVRTQLYLLDEQPEAALADIEAVLARQPDLLRAHMMRVQVLEELGRRDDAVEAVDRIAKAAADKPDVLVQLATFYQQFKQYDQAVDTLTRAIDQRDDNFLAIRLRGDMLLSIGKHTAALADFERAYDLQPDDSGLLNNYAWTLATSPYDEVRDGKRAIELAKRAAELTDFEKPHILSTLAAAYAETGDFERAIEYSEKAVELEKQADKVAAATPDIDDQLANELASYRQGKPWRELQNEEEQDPTGEPPSTTPLLEPENDEFDRAFDF